ncbi:MAG: Mini-ribonuclease 3 [Candidatus Izemoplasmatales bacterium]|uniref:Mini-ribonuclease 3 n=1 Tax=Hujiaoplasma nucleasis TaxID=2725268 RepID=A0A7L6N4Z7_9MOLU|nr:ribonuclease III domain-containing protein [Hujiaoplasma nucleasis]QLY40318.1 ribonuclease III [Hujiaoplasma nucleasis]
MILYNGLTLAYLGDAIYELSIRNYLLSEGLTKVNDLHQACIQYTKSQSQSHVVLQMLDGFLSEEEIAIYKRGRNQSSTHKPKNTDIQTYNQSTGFEAVIGYLYLDHKKDRMQEIIDKSIEIINQEVRK